MNAKDKAIVKRMKEIRGLLANFGAQLSGFDPGVSAFLKNKKAGGVGYDTGYWGEHLSFNGTEWEWLEPLLKELVALRKEKKK